MVIDAHHDSFFDIYDLSMPYTYFVDLPCMCRPKYGADVVSSGLCHEDFYISNGIYSPGPTLHIYIGPFKANVT